MTIRTLLLILDILVFAATCSGQVLRVRVSADNGFNLGSGTCVGYLKSGRCAVLTAYHVVGHDVRKIEVESSDGDWMPARYLGGKCGRGHDVALLAVDGLRELRFPLAESGARPGEPVRAIGYPHGRYVANDGKAWPDPNNTNWYTTTVDQGHSGGCVLISRDRKGYVVGVITGGKTGETWSTSLADIRAFVRETVGYIPGERGQQTTERNSKVKVLYFTSAFCGPCKRTTPIADQLKRDGYNIEKVSAETNRAAFSQYGVTRIPAFLAVKDGKVIRRIVGVATKSEIIQLFRDPPLRSSRTGGCAEPRPQTYPNGPVTTVPDRPISPRPDPGLSRCDCNERWVGLDRRVRELDRIVEDNHARLGDELERLKRQLSELKENQPTIESIAAYLVEHHRETLKGEQGATGSRGEPGPAGKVDVVFHDDGKVVRRHEDLVSGSTVHADVKRFLKEE